MKKNLTAVIAVTIFIILIIAFSSKKEEADKPVSKVSVEQSTQTEVKPAPKKSQLKEADKAFRDGNYIEARKLYMKEMQSLNDVNKLAAVKKKIEKINMDLLFSPASDDCSIDYIVKPNDALSKIARKYKTAVNLIKRANGLSTDVIRVGQKLKVNNCKFSVAVDQSQNLLFLKRSGEVVKTYVISSGTDNSSPVGVFKIVNKLIDPTWFRTGAVIPSDSPENVLGTRWMGFDLKGYGIHGTTEPDR